MDLCHKIRIAQPIRRTHVGVRQTDQKTGHHKTLTYFGQANGQTCPRAYSVKPLIDWAEEKPNLDAAEQCQTTIGNKKCVIDALQSHHASRSQRFKLWMTFVQAVGLRIEAK